MNRSTSENTVHFLASECEKNFAYQPFLVKRNPLPTIFNSTVNRCVTPFVLVFVQLSQDIIRVATSTVLRSFDVPQNVSNHFRFFFGQIQIYHKTKSINNLVEVKTLLGDFKENLRGGVVKFLMGGWYCPLLPRRINQAYTNNK